MNGPLDDVKGGKTEAEATATAEGHRPTPVCATLGVEVALAQFMDVWASLRRQELLLHARVFSLRLEM